MVNIWSFFDHIIGSCCPLCRAPGHGICAGCLADLPQNEHPCRRCALPLPHGAPPGGECADCQAHPPSFDTSVAPLLYQAPVDDLIARFKYHHRLDLGRVLADRLSADVDTEEPNPEVLRRVGHAVAAAGGSVPWRSDCFVQAIAANRILRKYGYTSTIRLGVDKTDKDQLLAHAWLTCSETIVTGGAAAHRYVEIHSLGE